MALDRWQVSTLKYDRFKGKPVVWTLILHAETKELAVLRSQLEEAGIEIETHDNGQIFRFKAELAGVDCSGKLYRWAGTGKPWPDYYNLTFRADQLIPYDVLEELLGLLPVIRPDDHCWMTLGLELQRAIKVSVSATWRPGRKGEFPTQSTYLEVVNHLRPLAKQMA